MTEITDPVRSPPSSAALALDSDGLSEAARFVDTFVAPSKTFTDICRSSRWWFPFLVSMIVSLAFAHAVERNVGWQQVVDNEIRQSPKLQEQFANLESTEVTERRQGMVSFHRYLAWGGPAFWLVISALCAAVLLATINFGFGGEATFGRMFAVWVYGTLPLTIKLALATIVLFAGLSPEQFNLQNTVGTNLGYYLPSDWNKGIIMLGTSVDILTLWTVVLLTIGCSIVGKISRAMAAVAVVGWWIIIVLASVAGAVVNSSTGR